MQDNKDVGPTVSGAQQALQKSLHKLRQIAQAEAPAIIWLARGVEGPSAHPNRPGLKAVSEMVGLIHLAEAQGRVMKRLLREAGLVKDDDEFDAILAAEIDRLAEERAAVVRAEDGGYNTCFEFQPLPGAA